MKYVSCNLCGVVQDFDKPKKKEDDHGVHLQCAVCSYEIYDKTVEKQLSKCSAACKDV